MEAGRRRERGREAGKKGGGREERGTREGGEREEGGRREGGGREEGGRRKGGEREGEGCSRMEDRWRQRDEEDRARVCPACSFSSLTG